MFVTPAIRRFFWAALAAALMLLAGPAAAQQQEALGEVQLVTYNDSDKNSGVWIDGQYAGYLQNFWGNRKIMLPAGEHEITVRKGGYKTFTTKIQVQPGAPTLVPVMLELDVTTQYPTGATADLKILASPGRAAVLIDGVYVGYASDIGGRFKSLIVTPGKRHVRIEMPGYRTFETDIDLVAGQKAEIRTALVRGGPELDGPLRLEQAVIREGASSLQLRPGRMHLFGMAAGAPDRYTPFSLGQAEAVFHQQGQLAAAVAYTSEPLNSFATQAERHVIGGVSVAGSYAGFRAFYGSNPSAGASFVQADFTVERESLVVVLGLASSQQQIELQGLPGLQVDALHSGPAASAAMVIAHTRLPPGNYTVVERSAPLAGASLPGAMADLVAVFVFSPSGDNWPQ
jgi:hypothetical protein